MSDGPAGLSLDRNYLLAELSRIDVLIQREVRRWQAAGQDPSYALRGLSITDQEAQALAQFDFGRNWGSADELSPEETALFSQAYAQAQEHAASLLSQARRLGRLPRFAQVVEAFGLTPFERDLLLLCLAPALDLRYERLYGYLQDDITRKQPTLHLALNLLCDGGDQRLDELARFYSDAPVLSYRLVQRQGEGGVLGQSLQAGETVTAWLLGKYRPADEISDCVHLVEVARASGGSQEIHADSQSAGSSSGRRSAEEDWTDPPQEETVDWQGLVSGQENPPVLVFFGVNRLAQRSAARQCAAQLGRGLLEVDLVKVARALAPQSSAGQPGVGLSGALEGLRMVLRDARLTGALPFLDGWDSVISGTDPGRAPSAPTGGDGEPVGASDLMAELFAYPDVVILGGELPWQVRDIARQRRVHTFEFVIPSTAERLALWQYWTDQSSSPKEAGLPLSVLAGQFVLSSGQIRDAVATATDIVHQQGLPLSAVALFEAARLHSAGHLGTLAHKIEPRYSWDDIILPDDQLAMLKEIVNTVYGRPMVLETWGIGRKLVASSGVPVLFSGPPGTGKTMAAEVIARELKLDLYKIDLSLVVSKYIGETEKTLEQIFRMAEASNAILFFDEADAIFGKRSEVKDAHDRYANIEVSYLLQRMEQYNGITVLATNLRANLDDAFTRRLNAAIDFPFPDQEHRLRIWKTLIPPGLPCEADIDFALLAQRFKLAGGNIRNIIVSAAYTAASDGGTVKMEHLLHGARREMQKMGRLVNEADMRFRRDDGEMMVGAPRAARSQVREGR